MIIIILLRIIESRLRFRTHSFYDNTRCRRIRCRRRAPPQDTVLFYVYARVRSCTGSETTSPLVYCSPMYSVGEHTAARVLSCLPPQSDSAARSFGRDYVGPSFPHPGNPARHHRWRWFYPRDVGVPAIKIYKVALPRYVCNRNFIYSLLQCCFFLYKESSTPIINYSVCVFL